MSNYLAVSKYSTYIYVSVIETLKLWQNNMQKQKKRDTRREVFIKDTAEKVGVSTSMVKKTLSQQRNNELIVEVFMFLNEGYNTLLDEVNKLIPFK